MIIKLYRKYISKDVRDWIYKAFLGDTLTFFRSQKEKIGYRIYCIFIPIRNEKQKAYKALGKYGNVPYPYLWKQEYDDKKYPEKIDHRNGLPYIIHNEKKIYFPKYMISKSEAYYRNLLIEQDIRSAHRYVYSYEELKGKTLLDIGCAEAIFTLDTIEDINHAYLFECDENWIECLNATFEPWKEKITIVRKYVSNIDDDNNIRIDTYFKDKNIKDLFLKMDIEGYERRALEGSIETLNRKDTSGAVCIYHLHDDEDIIGKILTYNGKQTSIQSGYIYFEREMRHAVMRFN